MTFGEMMSLTCRLASGLAAAGFKPRDRLLMVSQNITEYAAMFFAVARCRGHLTALNPSATDGLICYLSTIYAKLIVFIRIPLYYISKHNNNQRALGAAHYLSRRD